MEFKPLQIRSGPGLRFFMIYWITKVRLHPSLFSLKNLVYPVILSDFFKGQMYYNNFDIILYTN